MVTRTLPLGSHDIFLSFIDHRYNRYNGIGGNGDTTLFILIGLRIIQGIGAGMIMSMGLAMVSSYLPNMRGRAVV